jgi:bacterioferritin-associated ferredoxin
MDYECPKCKKWGMEWDGRAKVLSCPYYDCKHMIKLDGYDHRGIPSKEEIQIAIDNNGGRTMSAKRKFLAVRLTCRKCDKTAKAVLYENNQGMFMLNDYLCSDCLIVMDRVVELPLELKDGDKETVDQNSG